MNHQQFNEWFEDFCNAFPQTAAFVNSIPDEGNNRRKAMLAHWRDALSATDFESAKLATRQMVRGEAEAVPSFDRSLTAAHVAKLAGRIYSNRKLQEDSAPPQAMFTEPKFRCLTCQDVGMLSVWSPYSMHLARLGKLTKSGRGCYAVGIACNCKAGERYGGLSKNFDRHSGKFLREDDPIAFDPERWLPCGDMRQENVNELVKFMADYKPANHEPAFDAWNEGVEW